MNFNVSHEKARLRILNEERLNQHNATNRHFFSHKTLCSYFNYNVMIRSYREDLKVFLVFVLRCCCSTLGYSAVLIIYPAQATLDNFPRSASCPKWAKRFSLLPRVN